ncbi:MAG: phosphoglycerate kinase [Ignavibacteria bacterium]|nr:phosphoglycerate kinase [Ignavibacteria bacterium]
MIKSIYDYNFGGKKVLIRVDFNVPLTSDGKVADDTRIVESLTTIDKVIDDGGIPILISHLSRPRGVKEPKYSLRPVANYLAEHFGYDVLFSDDCIGEETEKIVESALPGQIVVLENLRFYKEEEENSTEFALKLKRLGDVYINEAFSASHRAHASTDALPKLFEEKFAGYALLNEIHYLGSLIKNPQTPCISIIGGAKIKGKIDVIQNLLERCGNILVGGGLAYTFLKAKGLNVGKSIVDEDKIDVALNLLETAKANGYEITLPLDVVIADSIDETASTKVIKVEEFPNDWMGVDIGPKTINLFKEKISKSKTIIWNGPLGIFEIEKFSNGTKEIAFALAEATSKGATTIIGGGDSASAITQLNLKSKVTFVSTGGGASLDFLGGKTLPGISALES